MKPKNKTSRRKVHAAIDLHSGTSTLGWMSTRGKMLGRQQFGTCEENLQHWIGQIQAREVSLTIESGPLTRWAAEIVRPLVADLIVCDPHHNRLVWKSPDKSDEKDVEALCELGRLHALHPVWLGRDEGRAHFRAAVSDLLKLRDHQRELKALIKHRYHALGIFSINGREVFHPLKRQQWLEHVAPPRREGFLRLYDIFDTTLCAWVEQLDEIKEMGQNYPEIAHFMEVPGIAEVGAHVFSAMVEDPLRFTTDHQLYRFCALGITKRTSDGKPLGYERLDPRGRKELKTVSYHAWRTGIRRGNQCDVIRRFYQQSKARTGTARHARLNTQRKILKTLWTMWKHGTHFDPELFLQTPKPEPEKPRRRRKRRRPRRTRS